MTLEEAINILGLGIISTILKAPGTEGISYILYHAILEEWLNGNPESMKDVSGLINEYGAASFQQAARVVANKIDIYGDVK